MFLTEFPSFHSIEKDIQDFNTIMNNYISKDEKTKHYAFSILLKQSKSILDDICCSAK